MSKDKRRPAPPAEEEPATLAAAPGEDHPTSVGPYRVVRVLGQGGMGCVYLAEQTSPVRRRVAIKLVKLGLDTKEVVARFEAEQQALALMNHPSIARVYEAGVTANGRPYFVMEHVPGVPITEYCDRHRLSTADRLRLFTRVCEAVQHAHQKAIIHRDIKPSNILVAVADGKPVPKIIDFGVAKAMNQRLTEMTVYTNFGQLIGTPEYMSPEQAEMTNLDIDTRTDIYSLGVLLYQLLVGALPFDEKTLRKGSYAEIQRQIREEDPVKPSTRLCALGRDSTLVAEKRRTTVISLSRQLRGDLDWITMRAMEKDRTMRYASASEFAADIERHLRHEPVVARPPSTLYRLRKFARKHRGPLSAAVAILLALVAGLVASARLYFAAERERVRADETTLLVTAQRDEILRLADSNLVEDLIAEAEGLWPALPEKIPAMESWLRRAREIAERLPLHRATLASLRERALPYDDETRRRDRETHPLLFDLETARLHLERDGMVLDGKLAPEEIPWELPHREEDRRAHVAQLSARVAELEEARSRRRTYSFSNEQDQWWHDTLAEMTERLEKMKDPSPHEGLLASVAERLELARTITRRTVDSQKALWARAAGQIANRAQCPAYEGLEIRPQLGLVPLGADPDSGLWEFAHVASGDVPVRGADGRLAVTEDTGIVLVLIPGGTFTMGSPATAPNRDPDERLHTVTLEPYFLSKHEMTQAQWLRATGSNPSFYWAGYPPNGGVPVTPLHPVERVNWFECAETLRRLGLRLPTEAQWERAARGGTNTTWWTGDEPESLRGTLNVADAAFVRSGVIVDRRYVWAELDDGFAVHSPVGSYRANPYGLHDVHGNVFEWCRDYYSTYRYPATGPDGERQPTDNRDRVIRGGGFADRPERARSADRSSMVPVDRDDHVGLRPARPLDP